MAVKLSLHYCRARCLTCFVPMLRTKHFGLYEAKCEEIERVKNSLVGDVKARKASVKGVDHKMLFGGKQ